jgi:hypothetical protein
MHAANEQVKGVIGQSRAKANEGGRENQKSGGGYAEEAYKPVSQRSVSRRRFGFD